MELTGVAVKEGTGKDRNGMDWSGGIIQAEALIINELATRQISQARQQQLI